MKRGSTWTYVLYLGRDATGKKQQKWVGGHRSKKEAEDALVEALERLRTGMWLDPGATTLGAYLDEWLAAMESNVLDTTFRAYEQSVDLPADERAQRSVWAIFEFAERYPDGFRLIFAADRVSSPEASRRIALALRRIADQIAGTLEREFARYGVVADTGAAVLAEATVGMCVFAARRAKEEGWDPEAVSRLVDSFLNAGLISMPRPILEGLDREVG